jgi:hypothetical protein
VGFSAGAGERAANRRLTRIEQQAIVQWLHGKGIFADDRGKGRDFRHRRLNGLLEHMPLYVLRTRRRSQRADQTVVIPVLRQEIVSVDDDTLDRGFSGFVAGKVILDFLEGQVFLALLEEYTDHAERTFGGLVNEMHFHRILFAAHGVLARRMEMQLQQLVRLVARRHGAAVSVVHLNGVTVIENLQWHRLAS